MAKGPDGEPAGTSENNNMRFARKNRRIFRIMVVEDEPLVAFDTEHHLIESGFEVAATVDSVAEALLVIERDDALDLALVDLGLADGSGIDVARAAGDRDVLVLFVTGNCPGDARALAAGCLSKPFGPRDLIGAIDAVESVLEGQQPKKLPGAFSLFLERTA